MSGYETKIFHFDNEPDLVQDPGLVEWILADFEGNTTAHFS
jgi:hypothetical protein